MGEPLPNPNFDHVYAIVRVELDVLAKDASDPDSVANSVTVKKLLWNEAEAAAEVRRLNDLNRNKGCFYFSQITRLERRVVRT